MRRIITVVVLSLGISWLYNEALDRSWFWSIWWIDIVIHFLTAFLIALIVVSVLPFHKKLKKKPLTIAISAVSLVLIMGVTWEFWESNMDQTFARVWITDTISDMIMNTAGALSAVLFNSRKDL